MPRQAMLSRGVVHLLLLLLVVLAWGLGTYHSLALRRHQTRVGCVSPDFFAPYDALRPHLDATSRTVFVGKGTDLWPYFRAQYALAPEVLDYSPVEFAIRRIEVRQPTTLILAFEDESVQEEARERLASEAHQRGFAVGTTNVEPGLLLMRLQEP